MLKTFIKEFVLGNTDLLFSRNLIGRTLREKGLKLASRELGIPLDMQPDPAAPDFWLIRVGDSAANLCLNLRAEQQALVELINFAATAWIENRKLRPEDYMPLLAKHMNDSDQAV